MNLKNIIILVFILLLQKVYGQSDLIPLDLKELVKQSFQKYPKIESLTLLVNLNDEQVKLSKAGYLPSANGNLSYRRLYPTPTITIPLSTPVGLQLFPADNFNAQVDVVQPIIDFNTRTKIGKAKTNLAMASDNLEGLKIQLAYQIAQVYYSIIFLNKSLIVQQQQLELLNANLKQIKVKIENGYALKFDLLSTQVQYTNTENFLIDLQTQRGRQYNTLNMLTGHSDSNYVNDSTINQYVFEVGKDSLIAKASSNNNDIKIANDKIEISKWDISAANNLRMPTMNLLAGAGFKNGFVPNIATNKFNYYAGVGISIPILPVSRPSIQKHMAEINMSISQSDLKTQSQTLSTSILNTLQEVKKNEKKLFTSDDLIQQAHSALNLAIQRYKEGVNTNLDMLSAQTNFQNAQLSKLQIQYNLLISKMDLSQLMGNQWW